MIQVQLLNVRKSFGAVDVIHGIDIDINEGEFVALVGPSGCGKSTILRMIAGLEEVSSGEIRVANRGVNDLLPKDRDIAMVFQSYALYPHMKVYANIGFGLKMARVPKDEADRRIRDAAAILGLSNHLDRYPRQLSGGQRQRVAMGRAIVRHPKVFLFDEPLSNLDAKLRGQMRTEIRQLHRRLDATSVYVTHDQHEAMTMADKIVVLQNGRVEQIGRPLELYDNPANLFVAGFMGSPPMNLMQGQISGQILRMNGGDLQLPREVKVDEGRRVVLGFRPEHTQFAAKDSKFSSAEIVIVEQAGSETIVVMQVGEASVTAVFHERTNPNVGDTVALVLDPQKLHLFDAETGLRIEEAAPHY